jgi:hypothetical protein
MLKKRDGKNLKVKRQLFLDVHIMFATLGNPEELRPFVANFDRDIIRMTQFTKYHEAAPEIAKRLATGMQKDKICHKLISHFFMLLLLTFNSRCSSYLSRVQRH